MKFTKSTSISDAVRLKLALVINLAIEFILVVSLEITAICF